MKKGTLFLIGSNPRIGETDVFDARKIRAEEVRRDLERQNQGRSCGFHSVAFVWIHEKEVAGMQGLHGALDHDADFTVQNATDLIILMRMRRAIQHIHQKDMELALVVRNDFVFVFPIFRVLHPPFLPSVLPLLYSETANLSCFLGKLIQDCPCRMCYFGYTANSRTKMTTQQAGHQSGALRKEK